MIGAEPLPGTAKAGHDLVEHEQDPVPIAQRAQPPQIAVGRDEHAGCPRDRLDEDGGDVLRPLVPDHLFDVSEGFLHVAAEHGAVRIRVEEMHDSGDAGLSWPAAVIAAERHRTLRLSVEGAPLREDLVALGEEARDLDRVLVRFAAAGGEDRLRKIARRDLR